MKKSDGSSQEPQKKTAGAQKPIAAAEKKAYGVPLQKPYVNNQSCAEKVLWQVIYKVGLVVTFMLFGPILLIAHLVLIAMDRYNRRMVRAFQLAWSFTTVPHVRKVSAPAPEAFPLENWHLRCEDGRQRWYFGTLEADLNGAASKEEIATGGHGTNKCGKKQLAENPKEAKTKAQLKDFVEKYQLGLTPESKPRLRKSTEEAAHDGVEFLLRLQDPYSGHWPNDYSGPMFLVPGMVFTLFIIGHGDHAKMFPPNANHKHANNASCKCGEATRLELIRYLRNYQNVDGGWGQHTEGHSSMLGTVLNYVALRLLGVENKDVTMKKAHEWIQNNGTAVCVPTWGKVWLAALGLYDWEGVNPVPPELTLLPDWVPFSQGKIWCHSRVVSVPFSYLYGIRYTPASHPLVEKIKAEIYSQPYKTIIWAEQRNNVCHLDLYTPPSKFFLFAAKLMALYEKCPISFVRKYALEVNWKHIAYDDDSTNFICLGPVNKSLDMLVTWIREGDDSERLAMHHDRLADYLYVGPEGMRMSGYNGSQLWDTSFAVQAICACNGEMLHPENIALAHHYVDVAQVLEDPVDGAAYYRHRTKGAWNFSTSPQSWQVSDCTAEGLRVVLLLPHLSFPVRRKYDAVDEILSLRNVNGDKGWASYESTRGPRYLELLNCAELFKDVMTDYSYAECSSSCVHSLSLFRRQYPDYRSQDVSRAIREGVACIFSKQNEDGSFYGSWAVCFTYSAWIVADAIRVSGEIVDMANHGPCRRLTDFMLTHQRNDGGWGEDVNACVRGVWVENADGSQVVNTAWAVMAIMHASGNASKATVERRKQLITAVERGILFIMSRQLDDGDWKQERISGIFNGTNAIHYPGYKNSMTVWALGTYNRWKKEYVEIEAN